MNRIRTLLIAEAANPEWVSVPLVGWYEAQALARRTQAHLVTQVRNREAIIRAGWVEGRDFTAIDSERLAAPLWKLAGLCRGGAGRGWTTLTALASMSYGYFEYLIWKKFGSDIRAGRFDVVHRLTPLSPTTPSPLARKCQAAGVPFVLGPLNGGLPWPRGFEYARRYEREWFSYVRSVYKLLPGYRSTRACAAALIVGSQATLGQVPTRYRSKCVYVPENGIDPRRFRAAGSRRARLPLHVVFVGRLVPYKGPDMLLEAVAPLVRQNRITLELIGDGPLRSKLVEAIAGGQLEAGVRLCGWVDHAQVKEHLAQADILGLPSIREFGGGVVIEAMALGVVPIVVNYGGPAELVTPQSGVLVELGSRQQIIDRLRAALERLCQDPALVVARSEAAIRRATSLFTWDHKAEQIVQVYRWVLRPRESKPDFGTPLADLDANATLDAIKAPASWRAGRSVWEPVS